jgi:hypothetical protein
VTPALLAAYVKLLAEKGLGQAPLDNMQESEKMFSLLGRGVFAFSFIVSTQDLTACNAL